MIYFFAGIIFFVLLAILGQLDRLVKAQERISITLEILTGAITIGYDEVAAKRRIADRIGKKHEK